MQFFKAWYDAWYDSEKRVLKKGRKGKFKNCTIYVQRFPDPPPTVSIRGVTVDVGDPVNPNTGMAVAKKFGAKIPDVVKNVSGALIPSAASMLSATPVPTHMIKLLGLAPESFTELELDWEGGTSAAVRTIKFKAESIVFSEIIPTKNEWFMDVGF